jgi:hypothetical protein
LATSGSLALVGDEYRADSGTPRRNLTYELTHFEAEIRGGVRTAPPQFNDRTNISYNARTPEIENALREVITDSGYFNTDSLQPAGNRRGRSASSRLMTGFRKDKDSIDFPVAFIAAPDGSAVVDPALNHVFKIRFTETHEDCDYAFISALTLCVIPMIVTCEYTLEWEARHPEGDRRIYRVDESVEVIWALPPVGLLVMWFDYEELRPKIFANMFRQALLNMKRDGMFPVEGGS